MPDSPLPVVINRSGGTAAGLGNDLESTVQQAFRDAGASIDLHLVDAADMNRVVASVAGCGRVAIGGGDGTLGEAAGLLSRKGSAMAILPLGTRNHLARQLGIPENLAEAAKVAAFGQTIRIDLGRADDRYFVNNASLGLYSQLVRNRDALSLPKWLANIPAALHVLAHLRSHPLQLTIDGTARQISTPLLFIGNNRYSLENGSVGKRETLSDGKLSFYAISARDPWSLFRMALRTLVGRADPERDFEALEEGRKATIAGKSTMDVACDGEVRRMRLPLEVSSCPGALEVIVP